LPSEFQAIIVCAFFVIIAKSPCHQSVVGTLI